MVRVFAFVHHYLIGAIVRDNWWAILTPQSLGPGDSDTVARLGGDEFVVLLPELVDERCASIVAQKILAAAARPFILMGQEFRVTASIGISTSTFDREPPLLAVDLEKRCDFPDRPR